MNTCLITGVTGSGGSYLAEYILENHPEIEVHGIKRWHSTTNLCNIEKIKDKIHLHEGDLLDAISIVRILKEVMPYKIFHLASLANVRTCFDTPSAVMKNNIEGTQNLLDAVRLICPETIIQICSTSEVYGNPMTTPIKETHPLKPVNPYAVSKLTQEALAYAYYKSWNLRVVLTRMFAYINPRRADLFATAFAHQVARIEMGKQKTLKHGNLNSVRTLIDVRDAMETYWIASEKCEHGTPYNIGGQDTLTVGQFLFKLKTKAKCSIQSYCDPSLLRPVDVTCQIPDTSKFDTLTGWKPKYTLDQSIDFLMEHCRNEV